VLGFKALTPFLSGIAVVYEENMRSIEIPVVAERKSTKICTNFMFV